MKTYEVLIEKTATIQVEAKNEHEAYLAANDILEGRDGYSEYAQDGWEVVLENIEEVNP